MPTTSPTSYVVARVWNAHGPQDYLTAWDATHGTACAGKRAAMRFTTLDDAHEAADTAARLVPTLCGGTPIVWTVLDLVE